MTEFPSISLPLAFLLIPYGFFLFGYAFYTLFNLYHLSRYSLYGIGTYFSYVLFFGGTLLFLSGSAALLLRYDWTVPLIDSETIQEEVFPFFHFDLKFYDTARPASQPKTE
ncbi:MAG TPA: hypothetical protein VJB99_03190 [Patescibacteria group bacterium]|nr:hypothetical protein [Patescibacteria group bacterium]